MELNPGNTPGWAPDRCSVNTSFRRWIARIFPIVRGQQLSTSKCEVPALTTQRRVDRVPRFTIATKAGLGMVLRPTAVGREYHGDCAYLPSAAS